MKEKGRNGCGKIGRKSKLTKEQVIEIFNSTQSQRNLARAYNICSATVREIKIGKIHSKITGKKK